MWAIFAGLLFMGIALFVIAGHLSDIAACLGFISNLLDRVETRQIRKEKNDKV